jgi:non-ribosomal peptide synthetase component E (peptide arylation enzyme)
MIKDTLSKIETVITRVGTLDNKYKSELVALLNKLKAEVEVLPASRMEEANSLANFAQAAAHEAAREKSDDRLKTLSREGLAHSVKNFEVSHPVLVDTVNNICLILARIGI